MADKLFELFATLGLDTTDFNQKIDDAIKQGDSVADATESAFREADLEYQQAKEELEKLEMETGSAGAAIDGLVGAIGQVVEDAFDMIAEYVDESMNLVIEKGGELAEEYNKVWESWNLTNEAVQTKVGSFFLPIKMGIMELGEALSGITNTDKIMVMLDRMESYNSESFDSLVASLDSMFGLFSQAEYAGEKNVPDMAAALESQAAYWQEYADTLERVKNRVDPNFLASIADGTAESLAILQAIEEADTMELDNLMSAFEAVEETKARAAEGLHETQMYVDQDFMAMKQTVEDLVAGLDQSEAAEANAALTGGGVANGLAASYPDIAKWVDSINAKIAEIGAGYTGIEGIPQFMIEMAETEAAELQRQSTPSFYLKDVNTERVRPHASGLSYVPYNDYPAALHAGEAVLTRQDAEEWRSGSRGSSEDITALRADIAALGNRLEGMAVYLGRDKVGNVLSRDMAKESRAGMRYGV